MNSMEMTKSSKSNEPTVQTLIEAAGTTQRQLSQKLNVTELSINNWVNRRKLPRVDRSFGDVSRVKCFS
ncbi:MAG TPA: hypothetical protein DCY88_04105 [Cyanobacteria bacterium UBA11372]|nr:hypothetical protein [Cyanobacteria bacterium UBA11372]